MGDHTEAVSIDFDPTLTSYENLLAEFWAGHRCESLNRSSQYMKAVFYRDDSQKQTALESLDREAHGLGITHEQVATKVVAVNDFTYAESYHQKYSLSRASESRLFLEEHYATAKCWLTQPWRRG